MLLAKKVRLIPTPEQEEAFQKVQKLQGGYTIKATDRKIAEGKQAKEILQV